MTKTTRAALVADMTTDLIARATRSEASRKAAMKIWGARRAVAKRTQLRPITDADKAVLRKAGESERAHAERCRRLAQRAHTPVARAAKRMLRTIAAAARAARVQPLTLDDAETLGVIVARQWFGLDNDDCDGAVTDLQTILDGAGFNIDQRREAFRAMRAEMFRGPRPFRSALRGCGPLGDIDTDADDFDAELAARR